MDVFGVNVDVCRRYGEICKGDREGFKVRYRGT